MFRYGLHDGAVDDDQMFGCGFDVTSLARIARIEEQRRPFQADPIAAPSAFSGQFHLMFLAQKPFLNGEEPMKKKSENQNHTDLSI